MLHTNLILLFVASRLGSCHSSCILNEESDTDFFPWWFWSCLKACSQSFSPIILRHKYMRFSFHFVCSLKLVDGTSFSVGVVCHSGLSSSMLVEGEYEWKNQKVNNHQWTRWNELYLTHNASFNLQNMNATSSDEW